MITVMSSIFSKKKTIKELQLEADMNEEAINNNLATKSQQSSTIPKFSIQTKNFVQKSKSSKSLNSPSSKLSSKKRSLQIDEELCKLAIKDSNVIRILLLGQPESGKSTLVKQMKLINGGGFSNQELCTFRPVVIDNLISSMRFVLLGMSILEIPLQNVQNKVSSRSRQSN